MTWSRRSIQIHKPHFLALHCQEVGGKKCGMANVDSFVTELLSSEALKEFSAARVYLDKNYMSQEHFTVSTLLKYSSTLCSLLKTEDGWTDGEDNVSINVCRVDMMWRRFTHGHGFNQGCPNF
uniref:Uncharacterized protein n=1 Tax=Knipowitschia caucasica TaxID=637954 RepID=A0AAV2JGL0_KNICA